MMQALFFIATTVDGNHWMLPIAYLQVIKLAFPSLGNGRSLTRKISFPNEETLVP